MKHITTPVDTIPPTEMYNNLQVSKTKHVTKHKNRCVTKTHHDIYYEIQITPGALRLCYKWPRKQDRYHYICKTAKAKSVFILLFHFDFRRVNCIFIEHKMLLVLNDIFIYANCTSSSRNFLEGEQVTNSNQIILCGKIQAENVSRQQQQVGISYFIIIKKKNNN